MLLLHAGYRNPYNRFHIDLFGWLKYFVCDGVLFKNTSNYHSSKYRSFSQIFLHFVTEYEWPHLDKDTSFDSYYVHFTRW